MKDRSRAGCLPPAIQLCLTSSSSRFLREMQALRTSAARRFLMDLGAYSGAAWAAAKTFHLFHLLRAPRTTAFQVQVVDELGAWADVLWQQWEGAYAMAAVRDCATL